MNEYICGYIDFFNIHPNIRMCNIARCFKQASKQATTNSNEKPKFHTETYTLAYTSTRRVQRNPFNMRVYNCFIFFFVTFSFIHTHSRFQMKLFSVFHSSPIHLPNCSVKRIRFSILMQKCIDSTRIRVHRERKKTKKNRA